MNKRKIYQFLRDLSDNNSKEWMDENRDRYHEAKEIWLEEIGHFLQRLAKHDAKFTKIKPKDTIMRINNNRLYRTELPTYKDNFSFSPSVDHASALYVHVSPKESWIGGGMHRPDNSTLKLIRAAIDYDGEKILPRFTRSPKRKWWVMIWSISSSKLIWS